MSDTLLREVLFIPCHHQRNLSTDRVICLVHDEWLASLKQSRTVKDLSKTRVLSRDDAALLLAPSYKQLPRQWSRVCIKLVHKSDHLAQLWYSGPLYSNKQVESSLEHLCQAARENFRNLWAAAHFKYRPNNSRVVQAKDQFSNVVRVLLQRLCPGIYIHHLQEEEALDDFQGNHVCLADQHPLENIVPILAVIETDATFFIIQPYISCSLLDMVNYSPTILTTSHAKSLFILYQVLHSMVSLHDRGITMKELTMQNIRVDERLWIKCSVPFSPLNTQQQTDLSETSDLDCPERDIASQNTATSTLMDQLSDRSSLVSANDFRFKKLSECENYVAEGVTIMEQFHRLDIQMEDLAKITEDWQLHKISNFRYLMLLNHLAGRKLGDPNHHPVLPWVMDFTSAHGGYRDLSMSKFRLNKGDSQLDFTYETMSSMLGGSSDHIPHHVSDVLSDITYYVYKARRTPKHILCTYVRTKWVPNEYPQSLERMYQWTPDECIPEFFTDPTIFSSIHEDLPDLELPGWCCSSAELISRHMETLESEHISSTLHHWIDLTFGYKLSGVAAVKAKNVYLKLVDDHKNMVNHGVVQLFTQPHPNRLALDKVLSALPPRVRTSKIRTASVLSTSSTGEKEPSRSEVAKIKLPDNFDPTADLDHLEALSAFTCKTAESLPPSLRQTDMRGVQFGELNDQMRQVWQDMQQFGCLMCEMFLAPRLTTQRSQTTLRERFNRIGQICAKDSNSLPRMVQMTANVLLNLDKYKDIKASGEIISDHLLFEYPMISSLGTQPPTPALLLQPYTGILPFPPFFEKLYNVILEMKNVDKEIEKELSDLGKSRLERQKIEKNLSRKKVEFLEKHLQQNKVQISLDEYELILPYIKELFEDSKTTVQAAWSLLGLIGKNLGSKQLTETLLPYLTRLFTGESTTTKHMKLYHRTYLVQLLMHLGLETFVIHFCTLLVEAVAGYKDFAVDETGDEMGDPSQGQEEEEERVETEIMFLSSQTDLESKDVALDRTEGETLEASEDVRPDQSEDEIDGACSTMVFEEEEDEEEEHNLSNSSLSYTPESLSTDQVSMRSGESDLLPEDLPSDRWSSDHGSLHSISHLLPPTEETHCKHNEDIDINTIDPKQRNTLTVHFQDSSFQTDQSEGSRDDEDQSNNSDVKVVGNMIRSETDEFRQIHYSHTINICDIAAESLKWLSHKLGPLLTAKYLSKNLVRMLALCYLGEEQIVAIPENEKFPMSTRLLQGDCNAHKVLECLTHISCIYGEQVLLIQYLRCIVDLIQVARRRLTVRAEAGLLAAAVLLRHLIPLLSDKTFLEILKESIVIEVLKPMLRLLTSLNSVFPSGPSVRSVILYKFIDVLYVLGLRLGFELTRRHLTSVLTDFFKPFVDIYSNMKEELVTGVDVDSVLSGSNSQGGESSSVDDSFLNIKMDDVTKQYMIGSPVRADGMDQASRRRSYKTNYSLSDSHVLEDREDYSELRTATEENAQLELQLTFSAELALAAYIPLTSVFGSHHMEESLPSDDLIRKLCSQFDKTLYGYGGNDMNDTDPTDQVEKQEYPDDGGGFGSNVEMVGNRICLQAEDLGVSPETSQLRRHFRHKGILRMDPDDTKCSDIDRNKHRHLKGNWLAYWEHELGLNERDTMFNFKQIKLLTFLGHNNSVRSLTCLDNEISFISSSKDKTVKLWSLNSFGDGSGRCREQFTYTQHKKSVFSVAYMQNLRLVASCDSTVHIWDPFTGDPLRQLESNKYSPVIVLTPLPSPSSLIMTATTENTLRFLDMRSRRYAHEYKCVIGPAGLIKCAAVSPDGSWIAVGFSTGNISLLNLYTGLLYGTWKGHDAEILQIKAVDKNSFLSTAFDQTMKLWSVEGRELCAIKGYTDAVHCLGFYKNQVIGATTTNKIGVHSSCDAQASFTSTKLQSEVFKGVLTTMAVLPQNRTLLLGADNGLIRLFC